ncbi:hypothetical protein C8A00DRAFT_38559 [Chaetomidium leptoderma]|uniref:RING-type domain-containing protein n=1 Tax=Chaetomidium leptoderma TaxID=669021 RepID=A0AAN6VCJ5_9PEZI|nr:hypothetical protein C8A00DRAFT_38559 [Chaetomidium leptoderma]
MSSPPNNGNRRFSRPNPSPYSRTVPDNYDRTTLTDGGAAVEEEQTAEENFFPNIIHYLRTREGPKPVVHCSICRTSKISIQGIHEPNRDAIPGEGDEYEELEALWCGHVFGEDCLNRWLEHSFQSIPVGKYPRCPLCRERAYGNQADLEFARRAAYDRLWTDYYRQKEANRQNEANQEEGEGEVEGEEEQDEEEQEEQQQEE